MHMRTGECVLPSHSFGAVVRFEYEVFRGQTRCMISVSYFPSRSSLVVKSLIVNSAPRWRISGELDDVPAPFSLGVRCKNVDGLLGIKFVLGIPFV
jgi:hypothetical protein